MVKVTEHRFCLEVSREGEKMRQEKAIFNSRIDMTHTGDVVVSFTREDCDAIMIAAGWILEGLSLEARDRLVAGWLREYAREHPGFVGIVTPPMLFPSLAEEAGRWGGRT